MCSSQQTIRRNLSPMTQWRKTATFYALFVGLRPNSIKHQTTNWIEAWLKRFCGCVDHQCVKFASLIANSIRRLTHDFRNIENGIPGQSDAKFWQLAHHFDIVKCQRFLNVFYQAMCLFNAYLYLDNFDVCMLSNCCLHLNKSSQNSTPQARI